MTCALFCYNKYFFFTCYLAIQDLPCGSVLSLVMKIADWLLGRNSKEGTSPLLHADGATFGRRDNFSGDREPSRQGSFADDEATDFDESTMTLYAPSFQNYASGGMSINNNNNNDNDNDDNNNKEPPIAVNSDLEGILGENYEAVIIKPKVGFFHPSRSV